MLYSEEKGVHKYPSEVIDAFFAAMSVIKAAKDIRDLYALKSLHFEKLSGERQNDRSIRLNKQWRLTLRVKKDENGDYILILDIEDYHH
ncbi:MAG: type II toxin-antitoxin system RelE/ParE family toxin [Chloroflexota bacterium]